MQEMRMMGGTLVLSDSCSTRVALSARSFSLAVTAPLSAFTSCTACAAAPRPLL